MTISEMPSSQDPKDTERCVRGKFSILLNSIIKSLPKIRKKGQVKKAWQMRNVYNSGN